MDEDEVKICENCEEVVPTVAGSEYFPGRKVCIKCHHHADLKTVHDNINSVD